MLLVELAMEGGDLRRGGGIVDGSGCWLLTVELGP